MHVCASNPCPGSVLPALAGHLFDVREGDTRVTLRDKRCVMHSVLGDIFGVAGLVWTIGLIIWAVKGADQ